VDEGVVAIGVEHEEPLVQQHVDRLPPGAVNHELGAGLAKACRRVVNEPPCMRFDTQVDTALRIGRGSALHKRYIRGPEVW